MNLFQMLGGDPPTPEQRKARALQLLRDQQANERMAQDAIPLLRTIRETMRELTKVGLEDPRLNRARHDMATMMDDLQNFLVMPPPVDTSDT